MLNTPFTPWPCYSNEEIEAVSSVLRSNRVNYWTGDLCRNFESNFASFVGAKFAVALSNGTVALDLALYALGITEGDEVIVTSRTFLATVSSIVNCGATPIFADVDVSSQNITGQSIREVITPKTKAVICVHLAGWPCDMDSIVSLATEYNLYVIEDCAQAHGATYNGRSVGSIGHIGCWSFCQDKIMTTGGEGGMGTTNDKELWSKMWSYKDHGKSWDSIYNKDHPPGFRWVHDSFGTNFRMTEMQAAIGLIQLTRLNEWQRIRYKYASQIWSVARGLPGLRVPIFNDHRCKHAAYKCYIFVDGTELDRDEIMFQINNLGVPCFSGSCSEVYLEKAFDNTAFRPSESLPNAKLLGQTSLMFMCHPTLTQDEIDKTCLVLSSVVKNHFCL